MRLNGIEYNKSPLGNTSKFPITNHIITKATNQERKVVCVIVNFFAMMKIATAKNNDQIPHTAPFTGPDGKLRPSLR